MLTMTLNLGDLLISLTTGLLCIIGWFVRRDIVQFNIRLDRHDERLMDISKTLAGVVAKMEILFSDLRSRSRS